MVLPLAAGLFGRSDAKKARAEAAAVQAANERRIAETNSFNQALGQSFIDAPATDMKGLVADAEAAGFNPLTVMRSGGLSMYAKGNTLLPGLSMMQPQTFQGSPLPQVPSLGGVLAGAASDGFASFMTQTNIGEQRAFQKELLNMTLSASTKAKGGKATVGGAVATKGGKGSKDLIFMGQKITKDPNTSDAQDFEDRYGDDGPGPWIWGTALIASDAKKTMGGMSFPEVMRGLDNATKIPSLTDNLPSFKSLYGTVTEWFSPTLSSGLRGTVSP